MGDIIVFPRAGQCGQSSPSTGETCIEPAGHATCHMTEASDGGNCLAWVDAPGDAMRPLLAMFGHTVTVDYDGGDDIADTSLSMP